jgi:AcrR family transcriptional regulator
MPYPAQIDRETLIETARQLIEQHGIEQVSLRLVAETLGIKAPSLYNHVGSKNDLLRAVNDVTLRHLFTALYAAMQTEGDAYARFLQMCHAYRAFAHANPVTYALAYTPQLELHPPADEQEKAVLPLQAFMAEISGEEKSLTALRGLLALLHGWVTLELTGQFRRGGDLNAAFAGAIQAYVAGIKN